MSERFRIDWKRPTATVKEMTSVIADAHFYSDRSRAERFGAIKRFSPEVRDELECADYIIYPLIGESIMSMKRSKNKFFTKWHARDPRTERITSCMSEVAIKSDPEEFFLTHSIKRPPAEQQAMIELYSFSIAREIPGVKVIMGNVADYAELAFTHFKQTEEYLFGKDYGHGFTRTVTPVGYHNVASVGEFCPSGGLYIGRAHAKGPQEGVGVVPLILPA